MTFTQLVTDIMDRLNLSSSDAEARIGRAVNRKYRLVTSAIGLQLSRRATIQTNVTMGVSTVTFSNTEKIINVVNRAVSPYKMLDEFTIDELEAEMPFSAGDSPSKYAIHSHTSDTVTILINRVPQTAFTLYADVHQAVADLSGSNEPAFPESFHDVIIEGVLADELRKMEKPQLAMIAQREYDRILSDLRMWIAKTNFLEIYQGKTAPTVMLGGTGSGGGSGSIDGAQSWTQTGLITFDRDPSAPFAVTASSAAVANLDADLLDGQHGAYYLVEANQTFTDITTNNASTSKHGYLRKLDNTATNFLDGTGAWDSVKDSDLSTSDITTNNVTTSKHGFITKAPNDTAQGFRGDASWAVMFPTITQGRLTLTSGTPVTTSDVTGATNVYFTPYGGNRVALYTSSQWQLYTFTEKTLALGTLTNDLPYDVFLYDNAGTLTLESLAWSSKTARATALATQDGVLVKSGAADRKYLGTFHTTATTTTEDSYTKRLLYSYYNRVTKPLKRQSATASWTYTSGTIRQANADTANQVALVQGWAEESITLWLQGTFGHSSNTQYAYVVIGEDSTSTAAAECIYPVVQGVSTGTTNSFGLNAYLTKVPAVGYHFYSWNEATSGATATFYGQATGVQSGLAGIVRC